MEVGKINRVGPEGQPGTYVYVPPNVNSDTQFVVYTYGAGMSSFDWNAGINYLQTKGTDQVVILANGDKGEYWGLTDSWANRNLDIVEQIKDEFNITSNNVISAGFSAGGFQGSNVVCENIKRNNNNLDPQVICLLDAFRYDDRHSDFYPLTNDDIQALKDNQSIIMAFEPPNQFPEQYMHYIEAGVNVVRVKCAHWGHMSINNEFFTNGFMNFAAGVGNLFKETYQYQIFDRETNSWVDVNFNTLDDMYNLFGANTVEMAQKKLTTLGDIVIKSDRSLLDNFLNNVRRTIRQTNFLNCSIPNITGSSNTMVPSKIPSVVNKYFTQQARLLNKISNSTVKVAKVAGEIEVLDNHTAKQANVLNELVDKIF